MAIRHKVRAVTTVLALSLALVAPGATLSPAAQAAPVPDRTPYCGLTWGSLPESAGDLTRATVVKVRAGRHACFDRVVVDLAGPVAGYRVQYVPAVLGPGSGLPYPLRGAADLHVEVLAPAYNDQGQPTLTNTNLDRLVSTAGYRTLRQVAYVGSFEGQTTIGVGVRARLPFRVFTLTNPSRIVIDIAHRW